MASQQGYIIIESPYNRMCGDNVCLGIFKDQNMAYEKMIDRVLEYFQDHNSAAHEAFCQYLDDFPENEEWIKKMILQTTDDKVDLEKLTLRSEYQPHPLLDYVKKNHYELYQKYWQHFKSMLLGNISNSKERFEEIENFRWSIIEGHDLDEHKYLDLLESNNFK